jgi:hypothetical protein
MKKKKEKKKRRICYVQRYAYPEGGKSWQNATTWTAPSQAVSPERSEGAFPRICLLYIASKAL